MSKKLRNFIQKFVHILEGGIAILTLVVLIGLVGVEIYKMFTTAGYFFNANNY